MKAVTVLMYHAIVDGEMEGADSHYSVPPATFARQLQLIRSHGRRICSVHQLLYEGLPASSEPWPVCLTFDDGHLTNAPAAEAIAREEGRAEFFVNPSMVGKPGFLDWPALREMAAMGMAIQSHGMNHRYLDQLSPAEVRAELADSKAAIEDAIGSPVTVYAPAGGRMPENFLSLAGSLGYHAVCSSACLCHHRRPWLRPGQRMRHRACLTRVPRPASRPLPPSPAPRIPGMLRIRRTESGEITTVCRILLQWQMDRRWSCRGWPCCAVPARPVFWPGSRSSRWKC